LRELKRMIEDHACDDLPKGLTKAVLQRADVDGDGKLDFDEFYKLATEHNWMFRDMCVKYCRYIVPSRNGPSDQTGMSVKNNHYH
jgi:rhomboid-related protein 1/2/3